MIYYKISEVIDVIRTSKQCCYVSILFTISLGIINNCLICSIRWNTGLIRTFEIKKVLDIKNINQMILERITRG